MFRAFENLFEPNIGTEDELNRNNCICGIELSDESTLKKFITNKLNEILAYRNNPIIDSSEILKEIWLEIIECTVLIVCSNVVAAPMQSLILQSYVFKQSLKCRVDALVLRCGVEVLFIPSIVTSLRKQFQFQSSLAATAGNNSRETKRPKSFQYEIMVDIVHHIIIEQCHVARRLNCNMFFVADMDADPVPASILIDGLDLGLAMEPELELQGERGDERRIDILVRCIYYRHKSLSESQGDSDGVFTSTWLTVPLNATLQVYFKLALVSLTKELLCVFANNLCKDLKNAIECVCCQVSQEVCRLEDVHMKCGIKNGSGNGASSSRDLLVKKQLFSMRKFLKQYFQWCRDNCVELLQDCQINEIVETSCCEPCGKRHTDFGQVPNNSDCTRNSVSIKSSKYVAPGAVRAWIRAEEYYSHAHLLDVYHTKYKPYLTRMPLRPPLMNYFDGGIFVNIKNTKSDAETDNIFCDNSNVNPKTVLQIRKDVRRESEIKVCLKPTDDGETEVIWVNMYGIHNQSCVDAAHHVVDEKPDLDGTGVGTDGCYSYLNQFLDTRLPELLENQNQILCNPVSKNPKIVHMTASAADPDVKVDESNMPLQDTEVRKKQKLTELIKYYILLGCSRTYTIGDGYFILHDLYGASDNQCIFKPCAPHAPICIKLTSYGVKISVVELYELYPVPTGANCRSACDISIPIAKFSVEVNTLLVFHPVQEADSLEMSITASGSPRRFENNDKDKQSQWLKSNLTAIESQGDCGIAVGVKSARANAYTILYETLRYMPERMYHRSLTIVPLPLDGV